VTHTHTHTHARTRKPKRTNPVEFANAFFPTNYETPSSSRRYVANQLCLKVLKFILEVSFIHRVHTRREALDKHFFIHMNHICQPNFKILSKIFNINCDHLTKLESEIFRPVMVF